MINIETVAFIAMLNELVEKEIKGIFPFKDIALNDGDDMYLYYRDDRCVLKINDVDYYPIVLDYLYDELHQDAISTYPCDTCSEYRVLCANDGYKKWIEVHFLDSNKEIVIENGKWYVVS